MTDKGVILCTLALIVCFMAARRGLGAGVVATISLGYFYGILRGNIDGIAAHFIYDAGAAGMYLAVVGRRLSAVEKFKLRPLMPWFLCLLGWPLLLFLVPMQDLLVRLVGLRAHIFFLPFLLVGALMNSDDWQQLTKSIIVLNGLTLAFALAEVVFGLQHFYAADNPVNADIFRAADIIFGGTGHYRIPATFLSSAAYGFNMLATLPLLFGLAARRELRRRWRYLALSACGIAAVGVFLAGSRSAAVVLLLLVIMAAVAGKMRAVPRGAWLAVIVALVLIVAMTPRMQRFLTLQNTDYVSQRIHGSINQSFVALAIEYPFGNGLGGGGTSLPYFLKRRVRNQIGMENEYARILAEQGIPGLVLWLAFIIWLLMRPVANRSDPWRFGKWLARLFCLISFATAPLGTGMLDTIPGTEMLLLLAGWFAAPSLMRLTRDASTAAPVDLTQARTASG